MLEVLVLSIVLSQKPICGNTSEDNERFSFDSRPFLADGPKPQFKAIEFEFVRSSNMINADIVEFSSDTATSIAPKVIADRFVRLADDWSKNTRYLSSNHDLVEDSSYKEIIGMGWDVIPFLLKDLQENNRYWFPALAAITGVRPFDPKDAGNSKIMMEAWVKWGKRKGLI